MSNLRFLRRIVLLVGLVPVGPAVNAQTTIRKGTEFQVNTRTADSQHSAAAGMDGQGNFVIAWLAPDGHETGVFARRFSSAGVAQAAEFQVNTYTTSYQEVMSLAVDGDGDFVVLWASSGQDGSLQGVFARRFASSGVPQGLEFQVNSFTEGSQYNPEAAFGNSGAFIVAWGGPDGANSGVFVRRFSSSGVPVAGEVQVNAYTSGNQHRAAIAARGNGDFVVTWQSGGQDNDSDGVFARRFSSSGAPLAAELQVNSYTTGSQGSPSVAADNAGNFVVTWSSDQDGATTGIFGRRFDAAGAPLGSEFRINDFTVSSQIDPTVARDSDGDFLVIWQSFAQDGDSTGLFARRFHQSSGKAMAVEFQVNSYTTSNQGGGAVALRSGDFVIAWDSFGQDGSSLGVFAQRFAALATLDIDGNGSYQALTDALLVLRYLFGFSGDTLIGNAVGDGCTRCTSEAIEAYLETLDGGGFPLEPIASRGLFPSAVLDIDDDGNTQPLTDGLLVLRDAFGFQGEVLIAGAVNTQQCDRCTAPEIESYLDQLTTE